MTKSEQKIDLEALIRSEDPRIAAMRAELTGARPEEKKALPWTETFAASGKPATTPPAVTWTAPFAASGKQPTPPTPPPVTWTEHFAASGKPCQAPRIG